MTVEDTEEHIPVNKSVHHTEGMSKDKKIHALTHEVEQLQNRMKAVGGVDGQACKIRVMQVTCLLSILILIDLTPLSKICAARTKDSGTMQKVFSQRKWRRKVRSRSTMTSTI